MTTKLKPVHIWVDSREPEDVLDAVQRACGLTETHKKLLPTADVAFLDRCGCRVGIERKTVSDFLGSFADGRLSRQLTRLREEFEAPVLLLEGAYTLDPRRTIRIGQRSTGWSHGAVQMALFSLQGQGIYVVQTPSLEGTADVIRVLRKRGQEKCLRLAYAGGRPQTSSSIVRLVGADGIERAELQPALGQPNNPGKLPAKPRRGSVDTRTPSLTIGRTPIPPRRSRPA